MRNSAYPKRWILIFIASLYLAACVEEPAGPDEVESGESSAGILVVNEGVFGRDNASITFYDFQTGETHQNYFQAANTELRLGDTANSIFVHHDRAYIVMGGSNTIEIIELPSAMSLGRVRLSGNPSPRHATIANDTLGFVTALFSDEVIVFDPARQETLARIDVGPAPEGIAFAAGKLFVANSGLGDIRAQEPGAGTVSVIDIEQLVEVERIPVLYNCTSLQLGPDGLVYVSGTGSYFEEVTTGIAVIDPVAMTVLDTIRIDHHPADFVLADDGSGFVVADSAVVRFSWQTRTIENRRFIERQQLGSNAWIYTVAFDEVSQGVLVGNARDFVSNGEVIYFDGSGQEQFRFPTKINPGSLVVFR